MTLSSEDVADLIKAIQANADKLGLIWTLRPGEITSVSDATSVNVLLDGDTDNFLPATPISALGQVGSRGFFLSMPDGALYGLPPARHRVGEEIFETDSATFTAQTIIGTVIGATIPGRRYAVYVNTRIGTTVAGDSATLRFRYDDLSGAELDIAGVALPNAGTTGNYAFFYTEFTATEYTTTVVLSAVRASGTGNLRREASSNRPQVMAMDYVR